MTAQTALKAPGESRRTMFKNLVVCPTWAKVHNTMLEPERTMHANLLSVPMMSSLIDTARSGSLSSL